ncbi:nuclease-related domain-containing protein [Streptomyces javensis]|uniref:NERD domain-containing protein n=1 Tax=Streptomyces javensis TaxID=114698 RepID=A0ABS0RCC2_9ACTN|nr:NERD domain-containing protein [Streptomyces javensis]MBI0314753.1 NERD domain-containing protein [Streptomyces javensis]
MSTKNSAQARADTLRAAQQPTGRWARLKARFGFAASLSAEAASEIAAWDAGAEGERRTAELLRALGPEGWYGLYDRQVPEADVANCDFFLVAPSGRVFTTDAKLWSRDFVVHAVNGRLFHGELHYGRVIRSVKYETRQIERALRKELGARVPVTALIAMHNAPVSGGGFTLDGIRVVPADRLLSVLRSLAGPPDPARAATVAAAADRVLPRYTEEGTR